MGIIGTFGSWSIVGLPAPSFAKMEFNMFNAIGENVSPFTGQAQEQDWLADHWEVTASLPLMPRRQYSEWIAALALLMGKLNVISIGDPLGVTPQGSPSGTPMVNGAQGALGSTVASKGWTHGASNVLLPGDYIQLGYRLHVVTAPVEADGSGNATIDIWPRIRAEGLTDGEEIITSNATGLFRLVNNKRGWSVTENKLAAISLQLTEAL